MFDWGGFQVGIEGNLSRTDTNWANTEGDQREAPAEIKAATAGVRAGYDIVTGPVLLGVSGGYDFGGGTATGTFTTGSTVDSVTFQTESFAYLNARIGLPVDRVLPYLVAGVARVSAKQTYNTNISPFEQSFGSDDLIGWQAGIGVELAVTDSIVARLEYRHADFGSINYAGGGLASLDHSLAIAADLLSAGLSYKF